MDTLKLGSTGPAVVELQKLLAGAGFNPGTTGGTFDEGTDAAVRAFQRSEGLVPDGDAGPKTVSALKGGTPPSPDETALFTPAVVCAMFPSTPPKNIEANLPAVLSAMREAGLGDRQSILMALGTIRAETESFQPVREGLSKYNTSPGGKPFDLYDCRRDLGNCGAPDGSRYPGRGYVQLTGAANYSSIGDRIGVDLKSNPDAASRPDVAAKVLAAFIKAHEVAIRTALHEGDLAHARRLVNGGALGLDRFSDAYRRGLAAIGRTA